MHGNWIRTILLVVSAALLAGQALAQSALFSGTPSADVTAQNARLQDLNTKPTTAAIAVFNANVGALQDQNVAIALTGGDSTSATHTKTDTRGANDYSWFGKSSNGGDVILVVRDGEITGLIHAGTNIYRVVPLGGDAHAVVKVDQSQFPPEAPPRKIPQNNLVVPDGNGNASGDVTTYDVLVAYTPAASSASGGIDSLIQLSVDVTNQAYTNSGINARANLVGKMALSYTETTSCGDPNGAFGCALNSITAGTGVFGAVHTQRDALGADEVVLLISNNAFCGLAWLLSDAAHGYAVVDASCAAGNLSFPHEIGHNFGADHDAANAGSSPAGFSDNRGYCHPSGNWRTIMAYPSPCGGTRVGYFSNPSVTYPGSPSGPMGVLNQSNNARVHNARIATIAGFRQSVNSGLVSSLLPTSRSVQTGHAATAFATVINSGSSAATSCGLVLGTPVSGATFSYQTTNPSTNQPTGSPNTPASIPGSNGSQSYVFAITPSAALSPTDVSIKTNCTNASAPAVITGVNTLLLSASTSPVPDIVALAASVDPGYVDLPGNTGAGAFSVASVNVGSGASITVTGDTGAASLPVTITLCQTNSSAQCTNPSTPGASSTLTINQNDTPTFSIFVKGSGAVANDPANNRIFVRFKDGGGVTRGSTSVAVKTQ